MARTAPVPNIPPIPGMCPSIAVMGGGGAGGGGSGKGGSGKDGKGGGGSGDGADGADGDGRNAACGGGGSADGGGCPNHHGSASGSGGATQGDPVDFASGGVFTPAMVDIAIGGPFPLTFWRSYSTAARAFDVGFGRGITHTFAWSIEEGRTTMDVRTPEGGTYALPLVVAGEALLGPYGWLVHREADGLVIDMPNLDRYAFEPSGREQTFRLASITDRYRRQILLRYGKSGALEEIVDAVGRVLRFVGDGAGHVVSLVAPHPTQPGANATVAQYSYDAEGRLTSSRDADGHATSYTYDDDALLTSYTKPGGTRFRYVYDRDGRCVETWGELANGAVDPSLDPDVPGVLADGTTQARGIHHIRLSFGPDDDREAVDSTTIHRGTANELGKFDKLVQGPAVFSRTYDERGYLATFTDAVGATTRYTRDLRGRELRVEDPMGATTTIERDENGDIVRVTDPAGGVTEVVPTPHGISFRDPIGALFQIEIDERGLEKATVAPDGTRVRNVRDAQGNLVERHLSRGAVERFRHDGWGRCIEKIDAGGARTAYRFSEGGRLLELHRADGSVYRYTYDADGSMTSVSDARGTTHLAYGANGRLAEVVQPTGERTRLFHDREGHLTRVVNNAGETHHFVRRHDGQIVEERTFDGRTIHYRHDAMGRLTSRTEGTDRVTYERDLVGRIVAREHSDGASFAFVHDARGKVTTATSPDVKVRFEYDANGWMIKETQIVDGDAVEVATLYDEMAKMRELTTSLGHAVRIARDPARAQVGVELDGEESVELELDLLGREVARRLGGGGRIDTAYDALGRVTGRRVFGPGGPDRSGQPDWLGDSPVNATVDQRFSFVGDELDSRWDKTSGSTEYQHDPVGRLLRAVPAGVRASIFRYDAGGRPHEAGDGAPTRDHAPGGIVVRRGEVELAYDAQSRLTTRTERTDGAPRVTRHEYLGGRLSRSELPDGRIVSYAYDAFGRRMKKTVSARKNGAVVQQSSTRFVWQGPTVVQEVKTFVENGGVPAIDETTWCFDLRGALPWAQRKRSRRAGVETRGAWQHLVCDATGAPEKTVERDGKVAAAWSRAPFGEVVAGAATPLRMLGHYADEETGLHYNWNRYYDPSIGRYTTPDPIGLEGGPDLFAYAANAPVSAVDPDGLIFTVIKDGDGNIVHTGTNQAGLPRGTSPAPMPTVMSNAGARPSCAETAALGSMANTIRGTPDEQKAAMQNAFKPKDQGGQGFTMETYDFKNKEEFEKASKKEREKAMVNPCEQCGKMIQSLGITNGVVGVNPAKHKPAPWRPNWIYPRR